jgi:hypothetical protein
MILFHPKKIALRDNRLRISIKRGDEKLVLPMEVKRYEKDLWFNSPSFFFAFNLNGLPLLPI